MSGGQVNRALAGVVLLLAAAALCGCSISIADLPLGSASSDPKAKDPVAYLPVNEIPPARDESALNAAERAKMQSELIAARDRQASAVAGKDQTQTAK